MNIDEMPIPRVEWRPVDGLSANDYNPNVVYNSEMQLLKFSLMRQGWIQPILVTEEGVIIDGFHRATLAKADKEVRALTKGRVPCVVMKLTEADRMLLTIRINRAKGSHIALKMADIVHKLVNDMGVPIKTICDEIGAKRDEVDLLLRDNVFKKHNLTLDSKFSRAWVPAIDDGGKPRTGKARTGKAKKAVGARKRG